MPFIVHRRTDEKSVETHNDGSYTLALVAKPVMECHAPAKEERTPARQMELARQAMRDHRDILRAFRFADGT